MSEKERELAIFHLCKALVDLLGEEQAIADLQILYERHPEMFKNKDEVKEVIEKVVSEPEIIIKNPSPMSEKDYIAGKKLDDKKMGEIGVRQDENIVKIFHADEKNIKHLKRLHKKEVVYRQSVVGSLNSYTQAQSLDERLVDNNSSPTTNDIIPQEVNEIFHANKKNIKEFERLQKQVETGSRDAHFLHPDLQSAWAGSKEHLPATTKEIIPQNEVSLENKIFLQNPKDKSHYNNLSLEEKLTHLTNNQNYIENLPRARDILNQQSTMNLQNPIQEKESNQQLNDLQDSNQESKTHKFKKHR